MAVINIVIAVLFVVGGLLTSYFSPAGYWENSINPKIVMERKFQQCPN